MGKKTLKHKSSFVFFGFCGLFGIYFFQDQLFYNAPVISADSLYYDLQLMDKTLFATSKIFRFILNDFFAMMVVIGLFPRRKYIRFSIYVFLIGFITLIPLYLFLVFFYLEESFSYLNHIHRLVMNPILMMLLIPAFYYQRFSTKKTA